MFAFLNRLFASFGRLADSVEALASTADAVNAGLRERLGLEPADGIAPARRRVEAKPARRQAREASTARAATARPPPGRAPSRPALERSARRGTGRCTARSTDLSGSS